MGRIKDNNYYVTNGWMVNLLGLKGRELQIYAIIYGFTQDEETEFNGSITYLTEWLGTSNRNTVTRTINALIEKGLIEKRQVNNKGVTNNFYKAVIPPPYKTPSTETVPGVVPKQYQGSTETVLGGSTEMVLGGSTKTVLNNNKDNNNNNNKDIGDKDLEEKRPAIPYEKIRSLYNEICKNLPKCLKISENRKKHIAARWNEYGGELETFVTLFTKAEASSFLTGNNDRGWNASFDWLLKADNMAKTLEGKYDNKGGGRNAGTNVKVSGSERNDRDNAASAEKPRATSTAEYERKLRESGQFKTLPDFNAMFAE